MMKFGLGFRQHILGYTASGGASIWLQSPLMSLQIPPDPGFGFQIQLYELPIASSWAHHLKLKSESLFPQVTNEHT